MTIQERLKKAQKDIQELSDKLNTLEQDKQNTLQEILRLDGRIGLLNELLKEEKDKKQ